MEESLQVDVIVNLNAGAHSDDSRYLAANLEPLVQDTFEDRARIVFHRTASLAELDLAIDAVVRARARRRVLVVHGGDGTLHQVVTRLIRACLLDNAELPMLVVSSGGTMNVVANALGLTSDNRIVSLERTLQHLDNGRPVTARAHALKVNDRYGFTYGSGLPVHALERYNAHEKRGMLRAAQVGAQIFCNETLLSAGLKMKQPTIAQPFGAAFTCLEAQGHFLRSSPEWTAVLAGTIESIGLGCKPLYLARQPGERFHLIAAEHDFWGYARRVPAIVRGRSLGGQLDHSVSRAKIDYTAPMKRFIDGDMYDENDFGRSDVLACGPLLTFLAP